MIKWLLLATLTLFSGSASSQYLKRDESERLAGVRFFPLFQIVKDVNQNVLYYEAVILPTCEFYAEKPVRIFWRMGNGNYQDLNFFERKKLFPIDYIERTSHKVSGEVKAIKDRGISYPLTIRADMVGDLCRVTIEAPRVQRLQTVMLTKFRGYNPQNVSVRGIGWNGELTELPIRLDGNSLPEFKNKKFAGINTSDDDVTVSDSDSIASDQIATTQVNSTARNLKPSGSSQQY